MYAIKVGSENFTDTATTRNWTVTIKSVLEFTKVGHRVMFQQESHGSEIPQSQRDRPKIAQSQWSGDSRKTSPWGVGHPFI
jgi:hypothetical protein